MATEFKLNILVIDGDPAISGKKEIEQACFKANVKLVLLHCRDCNTALRKLDVQKFQILIFNTNTPMILEDHFLYNLPNIKNAMLARFIVISDQEQATLPALLKNGSYVKKEKVDTEIGEVITKIIQEMTNPNSANLKSSVPIVEAKPVAGTSAESGAKVDVRVINAIIGATGTVLKKFGITTNMQKPSSWSPTNSLDGEVSSIIELKSKDFKGSMAISFDKKSYLEVVSAMLMEEQTELNQENQEAVGEINNIIFGNSKPTITNFGFEMSIPKIVLGLNQTAPCPENSAGMVIPFETSNKGKFFVFVIAHAA